MIKLFLIKTTDSRGRAPSCEPPRLSLLRAGLSAMGVPDADTFTEQDLACTPDGKPYFKSVPGVHFNLSHSGDYLACAFSDSEVGLDLQEDREPHTSALRIAKRFFTEEEYKALLACSDHGAQLTLFYRLWTIKEAYLKYIGCGLRGSLSGFRPDPMPDCRSVPPLPLPSDSVGPIELPLDSLTDDSFRGVILPETGERFLRFTSKSETKEPSPVSFPVSFLILPAPEGYTMTLCRSVSEGQSL